MKHLPAIDGLRAVAVLAVVAYHAGLPVPAGFVGVDVFFVISGYLITALLLREQPISLLGFYARRVRRILPALAVVVVATLAASMFLLDFSDDRRQVARSASAAMLFVANIFFQRETGDYFAQAAETMPLLHLWSLAVEEQFYLAWPLLLILTPRRWLPWVVGMLAVASLATAQFWMTDGAAFYQAWPRFWELAAGGLIAMLPARRGNAYLGLAVLAFALLVQPSEFPGVGALPAVLGAALILHAVHGGASVPVLSTAPMRFFGLISYSLYLWHWPLLALYRATHPGELPVGVALSLCAAAVVLAWLSYRYVEQPFRRSSAPARRLVIRGALACCLVAMTGVVVRAADIAAPTELAEFARNDKPSETCHHAMAEPTKDVCTRGRVALWGDSMAYAWTPLAEIIAPSDFASYTRSGCPPLVGYDHTDKGLREVCRAWNDRAAERVKGVDTLILAGAWRKALGSDALQQTLAVVAPHVGRVLIVAETPRLPADAPRCVVAGSDACTVSRTDFEAIAGPIRKMLFQAAAAYPNVEVIDPANAFCTESECGPTLNGRVLYWDSYHPTQSAVLVAVQRYYTAPTCCK